VLSVGFGEEPKMLITAEMVRQNPILSENATRVLIEQTARGDEGAFEKLCRAYEKPLFHAAFNILGNRDFANDVIQDVRIAIWNSSKSFKGDCKSVSWMYAIVRHKAMDALRRNVRLVGIKDSRDDGGIFREKPELDAIICEGLKELSPEYRLVIILTYYFNLSQRHISQILQCPVGTVKSRLSHALKQLRKIWESPLKAGIVSCPFR
jgi:RNA polymerase sigma factor (sigma-70 family)